MDEEGLEAYFEVRER